MKRKCLVIGISTISVILLILTSLSNVVGYQSVKSTAVNDSPLFMMRTQKATNQQKNSITSKYLGKGINTIRIPIPDNKTILYQKVIDRIKSMDDKTFSHFLRRILQIKNQNVQVQNIDETTIITGLNQLRKQDFDFKQYQDRSDNSSFPQKRLGNFTSFPCWFPGRFILLFIEFILMWSSFLLLLIYCTIAYPDCNPPTSMTACCP